MDIECLKMSALKSSELQRYFFSIWKSNRILWPFCGNCGDLKFKPLYKDNIAYNGGEYQDVFCILMSLLLTLV